MERLGILRLYTVGSLGPVVTGAIGAVIIAGTLIGLIVRVVDPPIDVRLRPTKAGAAAGDEPRPRKKRNRAADDEE